MKNYKTIRNNGEKSFRSATSKDLFEIAFKKKLRSLLDKRTKNIKSKFLKKIQRCPVDNNKNFDLLFQKDGLNFVKCQKCQLVFINPQLNQIGLNLIYSDKKLSKIFVEQVLESEVQEEFDKNKFKKTLKELIKIIPKKAKVLDIGCSNGLFLRLCRQNNLDPLGIEISKPIVNYSKNKYNLDIILGRWEDIIIEKNSKDLVTFWASHSYTQDPVLSLKKAWFTLKKGGILMMLVDGNPDNPVMKVLQEKSVGFEYSRLWYFSPTVMKKLLKKLKFKVLKIESIIHNIDPIINYMDYKNPYLEKGSSRLWKNKNIKLIEDFLRKNNMGYKYKVFAKKI